MDPVFRSSRREALLVGLLWLFALVYTIGYSLLFGYGGNRLDLHLVWGIPSWVFWGIIAPWFVCLSISIFFAYFVMTDEDLGADQDIPMDDEGLTAGPSASQQTEVL